MAKISKGISKKLAGELQKTPVSVLKALLTIKQLKKAIRKEALRVLEEKEDLAKAKKRKAKSKKGTAVKTKAVKKRRSSEGSRLIPKP